MSNDRSLAVHALIEGDAIMLQTLWAQANLSQDDLIQLARGSASSDDSLARVPLAVRTELLFPYIDGFNFVRQAYRQAGNDYAALDDLFKNPPESTAQLLHPEKYRNHVHPVDVQLADVAARLGPDWRKVGSGVLGELDSRIVLEQWGTDHSEAIRVASGWSGDQWQLVEKDGRSAIVVKSTWETADAARAYFSAYARGLRTRFDSAMVEESSTSRQALTTPVAATDLRVQGNEVLTVIAFDRESGRRHRRRRYDFHSLISISSGLHVTTSSGWIRPRRRQGPAALRNAWRSAAPPPFGKSAIKTLKRVRSPDGRRGNATGDCHSCARRPAEHQRQAMAHPVDGAALQHAVRHDGDARQSRPAPDARDILCDAG